MTDAGQAKAQAVVRLGAEVSRQATVAAYNDAFTAISLLALAALAVLSAHLLLTHLQARMSAPTGAPASE